MSIPIVIPADVRRAHGLPDGPLALFSVWATGDLRGLWVGRAGQETGQRWPLTGIPVHVAQSWIEAAQGGIEWSGEGVEPVRCVCGSYVWCVIPEEHRSVCAQCGAPSPAVDEGEAT